MDWQIGWWILNFDHDGWGGLGPRSEREEQKGQTESAHIGLSVPFPKVSCEGGKESSGFAGAFFVSSIPGGDRI
jgi:hypothetical protein